MILLILDSLVLAAKAADASLPTSVPGQSISIDQMNSNVEVIEKTLMANNPVSNQSSVSADVSNSGSLILWIRILGGKKQWSKINVHLTVQLRTIRVVF